MGSNPVTTMGTRYLAAIGVYSAVPITVHTWPAARNPWTRHEGDASRASIAGGTKTCATRREKFARPSWRAWRAAMAQAGAVVSKPTAKKTICRSGWARARARASIGEYTMRTSAPDDFAWARSSFVPGTRSISPNEQKMTPGSDAMATARSMSSTDVTQTGHPGPWRSVMWAGKSSSSPNRTIACVWPPHTSMIVHGLLAIDRMASTYRLASSASRYSSRCFMAFAEALDHRGHRCRSDTKKRGRPPLRSNG